ncbi:OsmC family protein [Egibacter rhizosphaerae]|nr:OsmC family protein [Egibacter rhizosphaerae]
MDVTDDVLGPERLPRYFHAGTGAELGVPPPADYRGQPVRTWARTLAGMQKEAVVLSGATGHVWRLVSDEGPYLAGHDRAPCPLAFMTTGMVASYMEELRTVARARGITLHDVELVLDNRYTLEGSALRGTGTMIGGALDPHVEARVDSDATSDAVEEALAAAVASSPVRGLVEDALTSRFSLICNGEPVPVGRVGTVEALADATALGPYEAARAAGPGDAQLVRMRTPADEVSGVPGAAGSSLQADQSRTLHVRGTCTLEADGTKRVEQELFQPIGSAYTLWSDEAGSGEAEPSGSSEPTTSPRAPDAATYVAAGLAFCFMTQLGRYATIARKQLDAYQVVQDLQLSPTAAPEHRGLAHPVETHVALETPEGDEFARTVLDTGERTCFLHALCRSKLTTRVTVDAPVR